MLEKGLNVIFVIMTSTSWNVLRYMMFGVAKFPRDVVIQSSTNTSQLLCTQRYIHQKMAKPLGCFSFCSPLTLSLSLTVTLSFTHYTLSLTLSWPSTQRVDEVYRILNVQSTGNFFVQIYTNLCLRVAWSTYCIRAD